MGKDLLVLEYWAATKNQLYFSKFLFVQMNQCTSLLAHGGKAFSQRYYFFSTLYFLYIVATMVVCFILI